ncbi:AAA family ATPase [Microbacterium sp. 2RAF4]|uniref:AAA family ATPase n=1 Tax=Microbacterium sp. 2RAF4 TaxID=3232999 RepID=UPI003F97D981
MSLSADSFATSSMMKNLPRGVKRIWGRRVLGEFDYDIEFGTSGRSESRLRVIYAENGMGKTNFLRALYYLLDVRIEHFQALAEIPIQAVGAELRSGWTIEMTNSAENAVFGLLFRITPPPGSSNQAVEITLGAEELDGRYALRAWQRRPAYAAFQELVAQLNLATLFVGDDRSVLSSLQDPKLSAEPPTLREQREIAARLHRRMSVQESLDNLEKAFTRLAIAGISRDQSDASPQGVYLDITNRVLAGTSNPPLAAAARVDLIARCHDVIERGTAYEKYGLLSLRQVHGILDALTPTRTNDTRLRQLHTVIDPYLTSVDDEITRLAAAQKLIDTFVQSVNSFLTRKELRFSALRGISLVDSRHQTLDPESLSSGEKHLLLLMSNATLARFSGALVIIDEPELSLGLKWQRALLHELLRCTDGSEVQFLVASHSVQILGDIDDIASPTQS